MISIFKSVKRIVPIMAAAMLLTGCNSDVKFFKDPETPGVQVPIKDSEIENDLYYVKDGTNFIKTLPLKGSATEGGSQSGTTADRSRVLYAGPNEDTLIPTHYKGEIIAQAAVDNDWNDVLLERFKDMGYSVGFFNAKYNKEANELYFDLDTAGIEGTDFYKQMESLESASIRIVGVDHKELSTSNADFESGILIGMEKGESHLLSLYAGTYYHEVEVIADTQMFQSFEYYSYDSSYIQDTPNGYRSFQIPQQLKSGYYSINAEGLFRYVDYAKGQGNIEETAYNDAYYDNEADMLAQFATKYSFTVDRRTKNMTIAALYSEESVEKEKEEDIKGYIFSPDGTEYQMTLDTKKNTLKTDFTEVMPGKWTVNIFPKELVIENFEVVDNTPDEELTQKEYTIVVDEDKENIVFKCYFKTKAGEKLEDIAVTGSIITPGGETFIMTKEEETTLEDETKMLLKYVMPYAGAGSYVVDINFYPEKTEIEEPFIENNTETVTDTIIIEG